MNYRENIFSRNYRNILSPNEILINKKLRLIK